MLWGDFSKWMVTSALAAHAAWVCAQEGQPFYQEAAFGRTSVVVYGAAFKDLSLTRKTVSSQVADAPEIKRLLSYYKAGWAGDREGILALYEGAGQTAIASRYKTRQDILNTFDPLQSVSILSSLHFGDLRVVTVKHAAKGMERPYSWSHMLKCQAERCSIVDDQINAALAMIDLPGPAVSKPTARPGVIQVRAEVGVAPGATPWYIMPSAADLSEVGAVKKVAQGYIDQIRASTAGVAPDIFVPKTLSMTILSAKDQSDVTYSVKSLPDYVRRAAPWRMGAVWLLGEGEALVSWVSRQGDVFNMPLSLTSGRYLIDSNPRSHLFLVLRSENYRRAVSKSSQ